MNPSEQQYLREAGCGGVACRAGEGGAGGGAALLGGQAVLVSAVASSWFTALPELHNLLESNRRAETFKVVLITTLNVSLRQERLSA